MRVLRVSGMPLSGREMGTVEELKLITNGPDSSSCDSKDPRNKSSTSNDKVDAVDFDAPIQRFPQVSRVRILNKVRLRGCDASLRSATPQKNRPTYVKTWVRSISLIALCRTRRHRTTDDFRRNRTRLKRKQVQSQSISKRRKCSGVAELKITRPFLIVA